MELVTSSHHKQQPQLVCFFEQFIWQGLYYLMLKYWPTKCNRHFRINSYVCRLFSQSLQEPRGLRLRVDILRNTIQLYLLLGITISKKLIKPLIFRILLFLWKYEGGGHFQIPTLYLIMVRADCDLRAIIFQSADTAHLIASPKWHSTIRNMYCFSWFKMTTRNHPLDYSNIAVQ